MASILCDVDLMKHALGEVVSGRRRAACISQRSFCSMVGISNSHLRSIEHGETSPRLVTVTMIAIALNVDAGLLVSEAHHCYIEYSSRRDRLQHLLEGGSREGSKGNGSGRDTGDGKGDGKGDGTGRSKGAQGDDPRKVKDVEGDGSGNRKDDTHSANATNTGGGEAHAPRDEEGNSIIDEIDDLTIIADRSTDNGSLSNLTGSENDNPAEDKPRSHADNGNSHPTTERKGGSSGSVNDKPTTKRKVKATSSKNTKDNYPPSSTPKHSPGDAEA